MKKRKIAVLIGLFACVLCVTSITVDENNVLCAVGAEEATAAVHLHKPDVVVADFDVGHAEGSTFCGLVKQMAPMRLLFISASQDDEINLLNAGADDWMKKPYKMSVLYARIQALLRMA